MSRLLVHHCPTLPVILRDNIDPSSIYADYDLFLFPYRTSHSIFIPTSLLEAFSSGIPVLASDQAMYRSLTMPDGDPICGLHRVGDHFDLAHALISMSQTYEAAATRAREARTSIREFWNLDQSVDDLVAALRSVAHSTRQ